MNFVKNGGSDASIQSMCANGGICPHATNQDCLQAGYSNASHTYETYVVQNSVGGLNFSIG